MIVVELSFKSWAKVKHISKDDAASRHSASTCRNSTEAELKR
jgi:hypothetical protein